MKLTTTIDVALGRGQNMRESWHATAGRKDKEKKATKKALESHTNTNQLVSVLAYFDDLGARITVVRPYSPSAGPMDSDNLSGSFKYPRDEIAAFLGVDDGSPRLHFIYQQTIAVKLGMSVKKGRTKASPDYDTRPTVTIEVLPVQDIDPQVKRVRELEARVAELEGKISDAAFSCPKCGRHDYGLWSPPILENLALKKQLQRWVDFHVAVLGGDNEHDIVASTRAMLKGGEM